MALDEYRSDRSGLEQLGNSPRMVAALQNAGGVVAGRMRAYRDAQPRTQVAFRAGARRDRASVQVYNASEDWVEQEFGGNPPGGVLRRSLAQ